MRSLTHMTRDYLRFLYRCFRLSFVGDWKYYGWMFGLSVVALLGLNAYAKQFVQGLGTTGLTDQVSWGMYIANFTYLDGVAGAAVLLVIPVYIFKNRELKNVVIFGQLLAVAAIIMCLIFVTVDLGRPERFSHLLRRLNFPISMLSWDVLVLNGYLLLNLHICGYLIYGAYRKREPSPLFYIPFTFLSIFWALSVLTVCAFLYSGLGGRPFWNSAVIAPRVLASAFASGGAIMLLTMQVIKSATGYPVSEKAIQTLRVIITIALGVSLFLLGSEAFTEFYTGTTHAVSFQYLFFGLHGHHALVPWIWTAVGLNLVALGVLLSPVRRYRWLINVACVMLIVGIWIEKGMGLVIPAFVPSPLGEIVEYTPTVNEILVCTGVWAFGLLLYTIMVRVTVPVLYGELTIDNVSHELEPNQTRPGLPDAGPEASPEASPAT